MRSAGLSILILLLLVISLEGIGMAEGPDASVVYLQGREARVINETDGIVTITVSGLPTNMTVTTGDQNNTVPISLISSISVPQKGAMVFSQTGNRSIAFMNISHISLTGEDRNLTLTAMPLRFCEITALESITGDTVDLSQITAEQYTEIGVYLEIQQYPPTNGVNIHEKCDYCRSTCLLDPHADECIEYCCITYCSDC